MHCCAEWCIIQCLSGRTSLGYCWSLSSLLIFCLVVHYWSLHITAELSISPFSFVHFCVTYFAALLFGEVTVVTADGAQLCFASSSALALCYSRPVIFSVMLSIFTLTGFSQPVLRIGLHLPKCSTCNDHFLHYILPTIKLRSFALWCTKGGQQPFEKTKKKTTKKSCLVYWSEPIPLATVTTFIISSRFPSHALGWAGVHEEENLFSLGLSP